MKLNEEDAAISSAMLQSTYDAGNAARGTAIDNAGNVYVVDYGSNSIWKLDRGGEPQWYYDIACRWYSCWKLKEVEEILISR